MTPFPFARQLDAMDCGPACLQMIARHYGQDYALSTLREQSFLSREGVSLRGIKAAAKTIGLRARGVHLTVEQLARPAALPCIVHWQQRHFVVVYALADETVSVADPACGLITYSRQEFLQGWLADRDRGVALLLSPTWRFYRDRSDRRPPHSLLSLLPYLRPYRRALIQLGLGMLAGVLIQLLLPLLAQSLVDVGIKQQDLPFMYIVLAAQLALVLGRTAVDLQRRWLLLHISTRINLTLLSDFLAKLMRVPLRFFDTKTFGDLFQRIDDHDRIEAFLTTSTLSLLFAFVTLVVFSAVLAVYNPLIFLIFLIGSGLYIVWNVLFLKRRRSLDYQRFTQLGEQQSKLFEIMTGIREIKVNTCEQPQLDQWATVHRQLFHTNLAALKLDQIQAIGAIFLEQLQNIVITFLAVKAVLDGYMTLGMVLAIQYILGQLHGPIEQFVGLVHIGQEASISLERIQEVHRQPDEDPADAAKISVLPEAANLQLTGVSFRYGGPHSPLVLKDVSVSFPPGKVTAIVGPSGSGKTTLLKLLLGFYAPTTGALQLGEHALSDISTRAWRRQCGVVLQEGLLFGDTIAHNIALGAETVDADRLRQAADIANIREVIEALPAGYETRIGEEGYQVSQGQKQRLLIARAVYKQPRYVFFDEATNSLDAENERRILEHLPQFFQGRTVVIIAHRLSTVKHADQIVVLDQGQLVECGAHDELVRQRGRYYQLIQEQLELGNT